MKWNPPELRVTLDRLVIEGDSPKSDQVYLARRVTALGAGVQIDQDSQPEAIREAVKTVLSTASFRYGARSLRARIGEGGAVRAAEVLESMVPVAVPPGGNRP